jgi:hypothetical protein
MAVEATPMKISDERFLNRVRRYVYHHPWCNIEYLYFASEFQNEFGADTEAGRWALRLAFQTLVSNGEIVEHPGLPRYVGTNRLKWEPKPKLKPKRKQAAVEQDKKA